MSQLAIYLKTEVKLWRRLLKHRLFSSMLGLVIHWRTAEAVYML